MSREAIAIMFLICLVILTLWLMGFALERIRNRIRRLERMVGIDDIPPSDLDKPHWDDKPERETIEDRMRRVEGLTNA